MKGLTSMKDKIFGVLQRIGRSLMLPIAILPVAGLFLGIGGSFTNQTLIEAYGLEKFLGDGTFLHTFLLVLSDAGDVVFANLPLIFAIGVAIGMAKKEKEVAALSGAIAFFIMHASIAALVEANHSSLPAGSTGSVLGMTSLQMGVFGGVIVGLGVAALHNRFYKIELPQVLSFFGGTRFVPIISSIVYLGVGILMYFIWPPVQSGIYALGNLVLNTGYAGTWIYGILERALIPFGLHHVFYLPFWQTALGGSEIVNGALVEGAQNIFFAQLSDPSVTKFSVEATRFMAGKFPFMIFGLPGAALAMYTSSKDKKKKIAGGLLLSAAFTAMLTGITEPIEFTFLFVAPLLYVIHCVFAGLSFMLMHILKVGVGMTFSGGIIDLILFGVLQGNAKTNWLNIIWVGLIYFVLYYFVFKFLIKKFDYKTPGREADDEETKLYTRKDVNERKANTSVSELIIKGLGGKENISDLDCCATRLRITVKNSGKVSESLLKQSGAAGVIIKGNGVQVIYGPKVTVIKSNLEDYLNIEIQEQILYAPISGKIVPLSEVNDEVFSSGAVGKGIGIIPSNEVLYAPCDGFITNIAKTGHAIGIKADFGAEILIHAGIDTVKLKGEHFKVLAKENEPVKKGEKILEFDIEAIKKAGFDTTTMIVVCNHTTFNEVSPTTKPQISSGEILIDIV